jgi:hypothetical protein
MDQLQNGQTREPLLVPRDINMAEASCNQAFGVCGFYIGITNNLFILNEPNPHFQSRDQVQQLLFQQRHPKKRPKHIFLKRLRLSQGYKKYKRKWSNHKRKKKNWEIFQIPCLREAS